MQRCRCTVPVLRTVLLRCPALLRGKMHTNVGARLPLKSRQTLNLEVFYLGCISNFIKEQRMELLGTECSCPPKIHMRKP